MYKIYTLVVDGTKVAVNVLLVNAVYPGRTGTVITMTNNEKFVVEENFEFVVSELNYL